jgi:hypothetical protein
VLSLVGHKNPEGIAALNGGILAFMDFIGVKNVKKQMRYFCAYPRKALQLLLGKLSRENGSTDKPCQISHTPILVEEKLLY